MNITALRIRKVGFSVSHPSCWKALVRGVAPSIEHRDILAAIDCDLLLDVGANRGQFSLMARILNPTLLIQAFEPLPSEAAIFRQIFRGKQGVALHEFALGDKCYRGEFHVSARADSSSLLPIGELQERLFPETKEVGIRVVDVATLDTLHDLWSGAKRALLKLDVQGFELSVLQGARGALRHCQYVYAECSHVALYAGQALYDEIEACLSAEGFSPKRRANEQWSGGILVQADYLFERSESM